MFAITGLGRSQVLELSLHRLLCGETYGRVDLGVDGVGDLADRRIRPQLRQGGAYWGASLFLDMGL